MGRLKAGVSAVQAQKEMSAIQGRLQAVYPASQMPGTVAVMPLNIRLTGEFRLSLWLLFGSVFVLLLIASINTAGLLLARGAARKREFAVRRALGAKRAHLVLQPVVETMVLAICGGSCGLLLAAGATQAIKAYAPTDIPAAGGGAHRLASGSVCRSRHNFHRSIRQLVANSRKQWGAGG